jgi:hypothetical protein
MLWDLGEVAEQLSALKLRGRLPVHPPSAPTTGAVHFRIESSEANSP